MIPNKAGVRETTSLSIELKGGVDENVPQLQMTPGTLSDCSNYVIIEGLSGGYQSVQGFERADGLGTPGTTPTHVLKARDETGATEYSLYVIQEGDTIIGATGIATALTDGVISGIDQKVEVTLVVDDFDYAEELFVGASTLGINRGQTVENPSEAFHEAWETERLAVLPVPGELAILGLTIFQGKLYAWRKQVGLDLIGMYVMDETLGWAEIIPPIGEDLTYVGQNDHNFEFVIHNFYAGTVAIPELGTSEESLWLVDGQNQARFFNETEGVVIVDNVGMTLAGNEDKPTHVAVKSDWLFLSYRGGSLQFSDAGVPTSWTGVSGSEISFGREITALQRGTGGTLMIFMENGISQLTGSVWDGTLAGTDVETKDFSRESGAYQGTVQRMLGTSFFMDDRGLTTLEAVEAFGDYSANSISTKFKKTLFENKANGTVATVNREKNQYRMYFNNGLGIIVSFEGKDMQGATFTHYPISVDVVASGTVAGRLGLTYFSSKDSSNSIGEDIQGIVFLMDSSPNFDGEAILTTAATSYYHYGTPRQWKRFVSCMVEAQITSNMSFRFKIDFDYHESALPTTQWLEGETGSANSNVYRYAEDASEYGTAILGSASVTFRQPIYLMGYGTNASLQWSTQERWSEPHSVQNILVDFKRHNRRV